MGPETCKLIDETQIYFHIYSYITLFLNKPSVRGPVGVVRGLDSGHGFKIRASQSQPASQPVSQTPSQTPSQRASQRASHQPASQQPASELANSQPAQDRPRRIRRRKRRRTLIRSETPQAAGFAAPFRSSCRAFPVCGEVLSRTRFPQTRIYIIPLYIM